MKVLLYFLFISMLFVFSCSLNRNNEKKAKTVEIEFIKEFITGNEIIDESFKNDNVLNDFCNIYLKKDNINTAFVYLVDASCSTCIRYFINFVSLLNISKIESNIIVVISGIEQKKIEFYLQQYGIANDNITFFCLPESELSILEQFNSYLFYVRHGNIINMCNFIDCMEKYN